MLVVALLGLLVVFSAIQLSRAKKLSFRYTVGWASIGAVGIVAGLLVPLAQPVADLLGISASAFVALIAASVLFLVTVQLSISISGLQKQIQALTEDLATLRLQVTMSQRQEPTSK